MVYLKILQKCLINDLKEVKKGELSLKVVKVVIKNWLTLLVSCAHV